MRLPSMDDGREAKTQPLGRRLAWFVGIWAASVIALGVVVLILRAWLN